MAPKAGESEWWYAEVAVLWWRRPWEGGPHWPRLALTNYGRLFVVAPGRPARFFVKGPRGGDRYTPEEARALATAELWEEVPDAGPEDSGT